MVKHRPTKPPSLITKAVSKINLTMCSQWTLSMRTTSMIANLTTMARKLPAVTARVSCRLAVYAMMDNRTQQISLLSHMRDLFGKSPGPTPNMKA